METNNQQLELKDIARRALRLEHCNDALKILEEGAFLVKQLMAYYGAINDHPITQLIAHRLRNLTCPNRDASYYVAHNRVDFLAELEEQGDNNGEEEAA